MSGPTQEPLPLQTEEFEFESPKQTGEAQFSPVNVGEAQPKA